MCACPVYTTWEIEFISYQFPNVKFQVYKFGHCSHMCTSQFPMCTLGLFAMQVNSFMHKRPSYMPWHASNTGAPICL